MGLLRSETTSWSLIDNFCQASLLCLNYFIVLVEGWKERYAVTKEDRNEWMVETMEDWRWRLVEMMEDRMNDWLKRWKIEMNVLLETMEDRNERLVETMED